MSLTYHHPPARSGQTRNLVFLLHGFGSSGAAMLGLGKTPSTVLSDTASSLLTRLTTCRADRADGGGIALSSTLGRQSRRPLCCTRKSVHARPLSHILMTDVGCSQVRT